MVTATALERIFGMRSSGLGIHYELRAGHKLLAVGRLFKSECKVLRSLMQTLTVEGHGRGRDEDFSSPPAQIPACATNAPGSSLGSDVVR
jgi:hypothetical protein